MYSRSKSLKVFHNILSFQFSVSNFSALIRSEHQGGNCRTNGAQKLKINALYKEESFSSDDDDELEGEIMNEDLNFN